MFRILRPGGKALIYAWAKDQAHNSVSSSYLKSSKEKAAKSDESMEPSCFNLPVHKNRTNFVHSDLLVPWKIKQQSTDPSTNGETFLRYYHVFEEGELECLVRDSKFGSQFQIEKSFYDQGNWCVRLCKESEMICDKIDVS
jgi:alkylated DNA repair protein alkB family protein 8